MTSSEKKTGANVGRREFLALSGAASALAIAGVPGASFAADTNKMTFGDIKVTVLSDGHITLPSTVTAPKIDAAKRNAALKLAGQVGDKITSAINVTMVKTPKDLIMVDVGAGGNFMSSAGKLATALEDAEIDAESVTKVIYTHAHPDHLWGTIDDLDEAVFPNAAYYMSAIEHDWWMQKDVLSKLDETRKAFGLGAQRNIKFIKDKLTLIKPGDEIVTGVQALDTKGHSPGHLSYEIGGSSGSVVVLGDSLLHPVISFQHPEWQPENDYFADVAVATRKKLLDKLAADGSKIVGYHLPKPGIGVVQKKDGSYRYDPVA